MAPKKFAVLIGIDSYPEEDDRLRGCVWEAAYFQDHLEQHYSPITVKKLTSPLIQPGIKGASTLPTVDNILEALEEVAGEAGDGDFVMFYYSGHGALKSTPKGEYKNTFGTDAALVVLDPTSSRGTSLLRSLELTNRFERMQQNGVLLTVILDSCHSGSVSRGGSGPDQGVRGAPWAQHDLSLEKVATSLPVVATPDLGSFVKRGASPKEHWLLNPEGYALLAACESDEKAWWKSCDTHGQIHGVFSCHLFQALSLLMDKKETISLERIHAQIHATLSWANKVQNPVLLGKLDTFLTIAKGGQPPVALACHLVEVNSDMISLNRGSIHGVCVGDEYLTCASWMPDELAIENTTRNDRYKIKEVEQLYSNAVRLTGKKDDCDTVIQPEKGWKAVLVRRAGPTAIVQLDSGNTVLREMINKSSWLQTKDPETAGSTDRPHLFISAMPGHPATFSDDEGPLVGAPPLSLENSGDFASIVSVLEQLAQFHLFRRLQNSAENALSQSAFNVEIGLKDADQPGRQLAADHLELRDGGHFTLTVKNNTKDWLYFSLFNLRSLCQVVRIYPSDRKAGHPLPGRPTPGVSSAVRPSKKSISSPIWFPEELKTIGETRATDILKIMISTHPVLFPETVVSGVVEPENVKRRGPESTLDVLLALLSQDHHALPTLRGSDLARAGSWACKNFIIDVVLGLGTNDDKLVGVGTNM